MFQHAQGYLEKHLEICWDSQEFPGKRRNALRTLRGIQECLVTVLDARCRPEASIKVSDARALESIGLEMNH